MDSSSGTIEQRHKQEVMFSSFNNVGNGPDRLTQQRSVSFVFFIPFVEKKVMTNLKRTPYIRNPSRHMQYKLVCPAPFACIAINCTFTYRCSQNRSLPCILDKSQLFANMPCVNKVSKQIHHVVVFLPCIFEVDEVNR